VKVSDIIADWLAEVSPHVYAVSGGGAMHLNDSICHHPGIKVTAMHHEQACAYAADAHARVTNKPAAIMVTCGPGGPNALTGIAAAFIDSIPMIVIAGQVSSTTIGGSWLRQLGATDGNFIAMAEPVTKYAVTVRRADAVPFYLEKAWEYATTGRPGPVILEVPLDVSAADAPDVRARVLPPAKKRENYQIDECMKLLYESKRPVIIIGNGVRLSGACSEFREFASYIGLPVVSSWNGADIFGYHDYFIGRSGVFGDRASNFAVQNADLILAIGTRLSIPQIGHQSHLFAPNAKKIVVDIDSNEMHKPTLKIDLPIVSDAGRFIHLLLPHLPYKSKWGEWLSTVQGWRDKYPVVLPEYREEKNGINSYAFIDELGRNLSDDAIVVTDVGMAFVGTMQSLRLRGGQRLFHSSGLAPMGYGLPAAIGACLSCEKSRQVVLIAGDGGMMFNLQELQTVAQHELPITMFILQNDGYHAMRATQMNYFGRESIASEKSGVTCPDFLRVAKSFGIEAEWLPSLDAITYRLAHWKIGPSLSTVDVPRDQPLQPRVQSRMEHGKFVPVSLEDMWPYLPRDELAAIMATSTNGRSS
jgi:acetolactate synthase-1/2/3 large subunit